jgi:hypothetical protein
LLTGWTHFSGVVGHGIDGANPWSVTQSFSRAADGLFST